MPATKDYFREAVGALVYGFLMAGLSAEKVAEVLEEITDGIHNPPIESGPGIAPEVVTSFLSQEEQAQLNADLQRDADVIATKEETKEPSKPTEQESGNVNQSPAIRECVG